MAQAESAQTTNATGKKVTLTKPCTTIKIVIASGAATAANVSIGGLHDLKQTVDGTGDFVILAAGESEVFRGGTDDIQTFWIKGTAGNTTYSWYVLANGATT